MKVRVGKHRSLKVKGDGCHFIGDYATSPNGRYTITWVDGHITIAGPLENNKRHNVPGKFLLLDRSKQIVLGSKERPNNGHVADNGTFILCDWTFKPNSGVFYAADRSGKPLIECELGRISDCGISPDGRYACCHTVHGDRENANKLHFFDLSTGKLLWAKEPETGPRSKSYRFDTQKGLLYLVYPEWGPLAYNFAGEFLDAQKWQQRQMERGKNSKSRHAIHALKSSSGTQTGEAAGVPKAITHVQANAMREDIEAIKVHGNNGSTTTRGTGETAEAEPMEASVAVNAGEEYTRDELPSRNGDIKQDIASTLREQDIASTGGNGATHFVKYSEELEKQLADARAEQERLKAQLAEARSAHSTELAEQWESAMAQLAHATTKHDRLIESIKADAAKQFALITSQVEVLTSRMAQIERERDEVTGKVAELTQQSEKLRRQCEKLTQQREAALKEKNSAASQLARITTKSKEQIRELTQERDQLIGDRAQLSSRIEDMQAAAQKEAGELTRQRDALANEHDQLQARLKQALADGRKQAQALAQQRETAAKESKKQTAQFHALEAELKDHIQSLAAERDLIARERDQLASELAATSTEAAEHSDSLRQQLQSLVVKRDQIVSRLAAVEAELHDRTGLLTRERDALSQERDALASKCENLAAQLAALSVDEKTQVGELTRQLETLANERDQLQMRLEQALVDGHNQAQALAQHEALAQQHETTAKESENQAAQLRALETELREHVQVLTKEREEIARERDQLASGLAATSTEAAEHSDSLRQQLEALAAERDQIAAELATVKAELDRRTGALTQERDVLASECERLAAQLAAITVEEHIEAHDDTRTDKAQEVGEAAGLGESVEFDQATKLNGPFEVVEHDKSAYDIKPVYVADEEIRALEGITDPATRRGKGQEIFTLLGQAFQNASNPIAQASICRSLGVLFEVLDLPEKAIQSYERALIYDEIEDVKHRLSSLKSKSAEAAVK